MRNIAALNLLLRARVELPQGFRLATEEFREGWSFSRSVDACRLEKKILNRGWKFIRIGDGPRKYGVGDTSQEAIGKALVHALRHISENFNAVEVEHIELTQYPWFFLARVGVCPYRIQQVAELPAPDHACWLSAAPGRMRLPHRSAALHLHSGSRMPTLKEMLILSRSTQGRA
ncbi:MAG: hypothetical protein ABSD59_16920 [Terracidiphilus sp.]|jgi:hypothetical protein